MNITVTPTLPDGFHQIASANIFPGENKTWFVNFDLNLGFVHVKASCKLH